MNHDDILDMIEGDKLSPARLSFAAEVVGTGPPSRRLFDALKKLLSHEKAYVREGAILGLAHHREPEVIDMLRGVMAHEPDSRLRELAAEIVNEWETTP